MFETLFFLVAGFFFLLKGSDILVRGASSIARLFRVSGWVVGVFVVGIGTSIPEFAIMLSSVFSDTVLGVGTIIGSNIFNVLVVFGIVTIVQPIVMKREWITRDVAINVLVIAVAALFTWSSFVGSGFQGIHQHEGYVLLALFVAWIVYAGRRGGPEDLGDKEEEIFTITTTALMILAGFAGVFLGGQWVVESATSIAGILGVSDGVVGLVIVGVGTSISELSVSLTAARKGLGAIAVGNIIGSNIFDFIGIFGIVSLFRDIPIPAPLVGDMIVALGALLLFSVVLFLGKPLVLERRHGFLLILFYAMYLVWVVFAA